MSAALGWLLKGPEEWNRRYMVVACPLCKGAHTLSQCPRWRVK